MIRVKYISNIGLTILLMVWATCVMAQTERGRYLVGGSGDMSEIMQDANRTFNLSLSPSFGVFVVKNFAVGGRYSFGVSSASNYDAVKKQRSTNTTFSTLVGPNFKYYLGKKALKGVASFSPAYTVSTSFKKSSPTATTSINSLDGFALTGLVGMAYFFNQHLSLETGMYITATGYQTQLPTTRIGFSLGLFAFLDKKKPE